MGRLPNVKSKPPAPGRGEVEPLPKNVRLCGFCNTARLVTAGALVSDTTAAAWHNKCRGHSCMCSCNLNRIQCKLCGDWIYPVVDVSDPDRCPDVEACAERIATRLRKQEEIDGIRRAGKAAKAARPARQREPKQPKRCACCGEETAGGTFRMGHDARLKGWLVQLVRQGKWGGGDVPNKLVVDALAELKLRGWGKYASLAGPLATEVIEAEADLKGATWLEERMLARWRGIDSGQEPKDVVGSGYLP